MVGRYSSESWSLPVAHNKAADLVAKSQCFFFLALNIFFGGGPPMIMAFCLGILSGLKPCSSLFLPVELLAVGERFPGLP